MTLKPTWQSLPLRCDTCGNRWSDWIPSGVRFTVAIAVMGALRCPACGGNELLIRTGPEPDEAPALSPPAEPTPIVPQKALEEGQVLGTMGVDDGAGVEEGP